MEQESPAATVGRLHTLVCVHLSYPWHFTAAEGAEETLKTIMMFKNLPVLRIKTTSGADSGSSRARRDHNVGAVVGERGFHGFLTVTSLHF